ncbi:hypothetical protein CVT24_008555 [Panaeolus cyanescens]|uniref:BTB domain-containing protein n=1 Tax=Panaeolus cyanescens TaxID=181874 RepID=A0A409VB55_9AGAR|nr:hypothetical protein CVT24_008555 [Panaeolus cyanescens]
MSAFSLLTHRFVLQVEQYIFKVHRYFFERESEYFAKKLAVPTSAGGSLPGSTDHTAFILDGVKPEQFCNFLWVFYNPKYSLYEADLPVWEDILVLAHKWLFPEVKNLAVREIEKKQMLDVARIKLYQDNRVDRSLLIRLYAALTEREEPINLQEGIDLGLETVLKIAAAREKARGIRLANGLLSPSTPTARGNDLIEVIRDVFKIDETAPAEVPVVASSSASTVPATDPSGGLPNQPVLAQPVPVPVVEVKTPPTKNSKPTSTVQSETTPSPLPPSLTKKEQQKAKQQEQKKTPKPVDPPVNPSKTSTPTSSPQPPAQVPQQPLTPSNGAPPQGKKAAKKGSKQKNAKGGAAASQGADVEAETEMVKVDEKAAEEVKVDEKVAEEVKVDDEQAKPDVPPKGEDAVKGDEDVPQVEVVPPTAALEPSAEAQQPQPAAEVKDEEVKEESKDDKPLPADPASTEPLVSDASNVNPTPEDAAKDSEANGTVGDAPVTTQSTNPEPAATSTATSNGDLLDLTDPELEPVTNNPFGEQPALPITPTQTSKGTGDFFSDTMSLFSPTTKGNVTNRLSGLFGGKTENS